MSFREPKHTQDVPNSSKTALTGDEPKAAHSDPAIFKSDQQTDPSPEHAAKSDARFNNGGIDPNVPQQEKTGVSASAPWENGMESLTDRVRAKTEVQAGAELLVIGLADQLTKAQQDPAKIQEVISSLRSQAPQLSQALVANTPHANPARLPPNQR